jgi:hypothetical protein
VSKNSAAGEHVVFHPHGGDAAFTRVADLAAAVSLVEWLHNERGVTDASVFALTPVRLAVRSYVRVEVAAPTEVDPSDALTGPFHSATSVGSGDLAAAAEALQASTDTAPLSVIVASGPALAPSAAMDLEPPLEPVEHPLAMAADEPLTMGTILPSQAKPRGLGFFVH